MSAVGGGADGNWSQCFRLLLTPSGLCQCPKAKPSRPIRPMLVAACTQREASLFQSGSLFTVGRGCIFPPDEPVTPCIIAGEQFEYLRCLDEMGATMHKQLLLSASAIILLAGTVFLTAVPAQTQGPLPWSTQTVPPKPNKQERDSVLPWKSLEQNKQRQHQSRIGGGTYRTLCVRACDGYYFNLVSRKCEALAVHTAHGPGQVIFVVLTVGRGRPHCS